MKPYGKEDDLNYQPSEKNKDTRHPHRWLRKERRLIKRAERKSTRQEAKRKIDKDVTKIENE